jgi:hypothetical protein
MMAQDSFESGEPRPRRLRTTLLIGLASFILGAVAVSWALTQWAPARQLLLPAVPAPSTVRPMNVAPAPAPVATLTSPAVATTPETVAITESRVAGLEARLAQIDAQAANASNNAARAEGLLIAFAVRRAIDRGVGLGYLEARLRDRFAETQPRAVAAIISAAQTPVTIEALGQQLDVLTPALAGGGPNESWLSAIRRTAGSMFIVRNATTPSPSLDNRLSRARLALDGGQVDTALAEVARLPSRSAATDWMAAARRYIEAHRALDILEAAALTAPHSVQAVTPSPTTTGPTVQ